MKLLVTGGSGYLGAAILRRALASPRLALKSIDGTPDESAESGDREDWQIAATYLTHPIERKNVAAFRADVRDADAIADLFARLRPNVVIHTAALMFGSKMMVTNMGGSHIIARAAAQTHARLIHISSDVIFDGEHAPYDEDAPPAPITPYAESKAGAERVVVREHPHTVIVRTSLIYGFDPLDPRTRQVANGEMPRLFTDEYRCPIFVDDLADALLELGQNDYVGVVNVAGPQRLSRYEFGIKLTNAFGIKPQFHPALSASHPIPRPRDCTLDVSRAQQLLHIRLRGVDEAIAGKKPTNE